MQNLLLSAFYKASFPNALQDRMYATGCCADYIKLDG